MEMGVGFLVGAMIGFSAIVIVAFLYLASRRIAGSGKSRDAGQPRLSAPSAPSGSRSSQPLPPRASARLESRSSPQASTRASARLESQNAAEPGGEVVHLENVLHGELQLAQNVKEVRAVLLTLAGVVSRTNAASDKVALAFNSAKDAIDNLSPGDVDGLVDAQAILVGEIDRMIKTNAALKGELDQAHQGIAEQRQQIEELRERTRVDVLTGINNRAAFDERLKEFVAAQERTGRTFTLFMIDIDFFKRVNDTLGHANGDRVLRGVAKKITASIRVNDFAARYGGEEFVIVFPETGVLAALEVAERMRRDISKANFRLDSQSVKITISGGLAESAKGMTSEEVITAADQALYKSKNSGRNRLTLAGSE